MSNVLVRNKIAQRAADEKLELIAVLPSEHIILQQISPGNQNQHSVGFSTAPRLHFHRNLLVLVSKTNNQMVNAVVKAVPAERDRYQAHARWREVADNLRERFRDVAALLDEAEHGVPACMTWRLSRYRTAAA